MHALLKPTSVQGGKMQPKRIYRLEVLSWLLLALFFLFLAGGSIALYVLR
jgi:hypothetical protein